MDGAEGARRKRPLRAASTTPTDEAYAVHHRTGLELPTLASDHGGASLGREDLLKDGTGCACVWPAAEVLCDFLVEAQEARSWQLPSRIIELGSGVGLPGLLAAKLGASSVTLTDYHPVVLSRLHATIARNGLQQRCRVEALDFEDGTDRASGAPRWPLAIGADLAVSGRGAASLARAARRVMLGWPGDDEQRCGSSRHAPGIFIYAHTERRAIYRAADGSVARESSDSALDALRDALSDLECREVVTIPTNGEAGTEEHEPVRLLAFGVAGQTSQVLPVLCKAANVYL